MELYLLARRNLLKGQRVSKKRLSPPVFTYGSRSGSIIYVLRFSLRLLDSGEYREKISSVLWVMQTSPPRLAWLVLACSLSEIPTCKRPVREKLEAQNSNTIIFRSAFSKQISWMSLDEKISIKCWSNLFLRNQLNWVISLEGIWTPVSVSVSIDIITIITFMFSIANALTFTRPDSGQKVNHSGSKKHMLFSSLHVLFRAREVHF